MDKTNIPLLGTIFLRARYGMDSALAKGKTGNTFGEKCPSHPFLIKRRYHYVAVRLDITERIQSEEEIKKAAGLA